MKINMLITFVLLATTSNSYAQTTQEITQQGVQDTPIDSTTLSELKNDVVRLSYGQQGRRVFVLKPDRSLNSLTEGSAVQMLNDMPPDKSSDNRRQQDPRNTGRKNPVREFAVTCNPLGEAVLLEIENAGVANAETRGKPKFVDEQSKLKSRKMQRLAELACLEPQFEIE